MTNIYVDADACPVKDEVYRVAQRYGLGVVLVSNAWLRAPNEEWLELVIVGDELDAADAWIVEHVTEDDIVVSADIPLAALCLAKGAGVLGPRGRPFTEDSIGGALATRELMSQLREMGRYLEDRLPSRSGTGHSFSKPWIGWSTRFGNGVRRTVHCNAVSL